MFTFRSGQRLVFVSGVASKPKEAAIADLRSGGHADSDCPAGWFQVTKVH